MTTKNSTAQKTLATGNHPINRSQCQPLRQTRFGFCNAVTPSLHKTNAHSSLMKHLLVVACSLLGWTGFLAAQPTINSLYPPTLTDRVGDHVAYAVSATLSGGGGSLAYAWYKTGSPTTVLSTSNSLVLTNIQTANTGTYYAVVSDNNGPTTSATVTLNVTNSPYLTLSSGNLVVARVGEGSQTLSATTGNTVYLDQYTTAGTYVNSIQIPDEGTGQPYLTGSTKSSSMPFGSPSLIVAGAGNDAGYEAMLSVSGNGREYIGLAGYCEAYPYSGTNTVNTASSSWRGLATINAFGFYNLAYTNSGFYSGGNALIRDMYTLDGTNFWTTGSASAGTIKFANSTVTNYAGGSGVPSSTGTSGSAFVSPAGGRTIQVVNGALAVGGFSSASNLVYSETAATNLNGLYAAVGAPEPTSGNITFKALLYTGSSAQPGDFAFSPDNRTIYIADSRPFTTTLNSSSGGIQRWDSIPGGYGFSYNIQPMAGLTNGAQGLTVDFSAATTWGSGVTGAKLYVTDYGATTNSLVQIIDNGAASTPTVLVTAGANESLRGVRFGPSVVPPGFAVQPANTARLRAGTPHSPRRPTAADPSPINGISRLAVSVPSSPSTPPPMPPTP